MSGFTYERAGVDYGSLDAFKRACQRFARTTTSNLSAHDLSEPAGVRGESAYLIEAPDHFLAHVEEGLGTKNLVADEIYRLTGRSLYRNIGIDTVATITNDLVTTGALPVSIAMHAAVGDSTWFDDLRRSEDLAAGFAEGCSESGAVWGGGETPTLRGIVTPSAVVLAGSGIGRILPKAARIVGDVAVGDRIVLLGSSGVQTNGLTLCRAIAERLPDGYLTRLGDGRTYGEALCDPSVIYARFVGACQTERIRLHYAAHLSGHGWRKLMRLEEPFVYRMENVGQALPIFDFIRAAGPVDIREAYATFNMGAGFAVFVEAREVSRCLEAARGLGYRAWVGGSVHKDGGRKAVEILPLAVTFEAETLNLRAGDG
jgi:phosphoribosylformylglycinamidine cyclo-ligase